MIAVSGLRVPGSLRCLAAPERRSWLRRQGPYVLVCVCYMRVFSIYHGMRDMYSLVFTTGTLVTLVAMPRHFWPSSPPSPIDLYVGMHVTCQRKQQPDNNQRPAHVNKQQPTKQQTRNQQAITEASSIPCTSRYRQGC